jgi:probable HAF family extracellular repeat protein
MKAIVGLLILARAVIAGGDPLDSAQPRYTIIDLGTLGGFSSVALAVNNNGQVAGSADTPEGKRHAYLWDPGTGEMTDLGTIPPTTLSEALDVNDNAQVVGISTSTGWPERAFLWDDGKLIEVGEWSTLPSALGINNARQVVGCYRVAPGGYHAFLWEDGVMTDLTETYGVGNIAWDINGFGDIIVGSKLLHADGTVITLPTLGGDMTIGYSLNRLTQVVGMSERIPGERRFHAFLWDDGEMIDLGALGGFNISEAWAINNQGQVVGNPRYLYDPEDGMMSLYELISAGSGWSGLDARDINDGGQIVGIGSFRGARLAFLMTPVRGDFDGDGDTDLADLRVLVSCFTGPDGRVTGACKDCDIDRNASVDLADLQAFHWVFTGPVADVAAVSSMAPVFNQ